MIDFYYDDQLQDNIYSQILITHLDSDVKGKPPAQYRNRIKVPRNCSYMIIESLRF
jgi:hypothetical protein